LIVGGNPADGLPVLLSAGGTQSKGPKLLDRSFHAATLLGDGSVLLSGGQSKDGALLASFEVFSPTEGSKQTGVLVQARARHTATRLPDGRVLLVGGRNETGALDSIELWEGGQTQVVGKLLQPRSRHGAALLPDGRVLIVGGSNPQGELLVAEVFDPSTRKSTSLGQAKVGSEVSLGFVGKSLFFSGSLKSVRFDTSTGFFVDFPLERATRMTTLPDGRVLACQEACRVMAEKSQTGAEAGLLFLFPEDHAKALGTDHVAFSGSSGGVGWTATASLLEATAPRPSLDVLPKTEVHLDEALSLQGSGWTGAEIPQGAPTFDDARLLVWKPLDGVGPVHLLDVKAWGDGVVDFVVPRTAYSGPGWLYVVVNGVPSEGRLLTIWPSVGGQACDLAAHCASGFCVDGVCCNTACADGCFACSKAQGAAEDGTCAPLAKDATPRFGCTNETGGECGFTGKCAAGGICALPDFSDTCSEVEGGRCEGGSCKALKGTCEGNILLSPDKTTQVICAPGRCDASKHACVLDCQSKDDCAKDSECIEENGKKQCKGVTCLDATTLADLDGQKISCKPFRCEKGQCSTGCLSKEDCAKGSECVGGKCTGYTCQDKVTVVGLDGQTKTCAPSLCAQGQCTKNCQTSSDCAPGSDCDKGVCQAGACSADSTSVVSQNGQVFLCAPFFCQAGACPTTCQTTADCQEGSECRGNKCESGCSKDRSAVTKSTVAGLVSEPCERFLCTDGTCGTTCSSHADCQLRYRCEADGQCRPASTADAGSDPGGCSLASPSSGSPVRWVWGLAALMVLARRRRMRLPSSSKLSSLTRLKPTGTPFFS
jgi:MYXO-CTERM domain-containing protein